MFVTSSTAPVNTSLFELLLILFNETIKIQFSY